jgi:hypothetical protein
MALRLGSRTRTVSPMLTALCAAIPGEFGTASGTYRLEGGRLPKGSVLDARLSAMLFCSSSELKFI